ncbi:hypothetical protein Tco_0363077 [Tanacetum coccineum]
MSRIREQALLRTRNNPGQRSGKETMLLEKREEKESMIGKIAIDSMLSVNCKQQLIDVLRKNVEVFAWVGSERTAIPRFIIEHQLKAYPLAKLVIHKKRPMTPDRRQALKETVSYWLKEGIIRRMDYSSLNKICAKDMFPFLVKEEELALLMGYRYKCFLRLPKDNSQIRMVEDDEENQIPHRRRKRAKRGSIPRRNSCEEQKRTKSSSRCRENIEKAKEDEHLNRPERIHVWSREGKFLRYIITNEEIRADLEKIQAIVRSPTPKDPNQIRSLSLNLTTIRKFIPKLAELIHPIREVRKALDVTNGSGWTNEAEKSFQKIKRKLNKLQTLTIPKEGEKIDLCVYGIENMIKHTENSFLSLLFIVSENESICRSLTIDQLDTTYIIIRIRVLELEHTRFLVKSRRRYAVSSLLDTAYVVRISNLQISSFKLQNVRLLACLHNVLHNYCN